MAYIGRGEAAEFQYASTGNTVGEYVVSPLGTASNTLQRSIRITDLKATCGATGRTIRILGKGADAEQQVLSFDLPADSYVNFQWAIPYKISVQSSTSTVVGIIASASGAGVKFAVSGYIEK
jgi:hypothetical protein